MKIPKSACISLIAGLLVASGCRMSVPVHTWKPPELESTVGKQVVVADVVGPKDLAQNLHQRLLANPPEDAGRQTRLINSDALQDKTQIQLAAASEAETSDVVLASVARSEGYDYVLRGEVLEDRRIQKPQGEPKKLTVSWQLFALGDQRPTGGSPVAVDVKSAIEKYPDLALLGSDDEVLQSAVVRETFGLITPSIQKRHAQIAIPYLLPGSKDIRRGNIAAYRGQWSEAESIWKEAAEKHPSQVAAIHNLALAAAASQDFSRAKELARKAIRLQPVKLHKETLVWIELRQREYHKAFQLPDPPEGWFVTNE